MSKFNFNIEDSNNELTVDNDNILSSKVENQTLISLYNDKVILDAVKNNTVNLLSDNNKFKIISNPMKYLEKIGITYEDYIIINYMYNLKLLYKLDERLKEIYEKICTVFDIIHDSKQNVEKIVVKTKSELKNIIKKMSNHANLNHIDVSNLTDLSLIFRDSNFNGDISEWDVSKVNQIDNAFYKSLFNKDISMWNVKNIVFRYKELLKSVFNGARIDKQYRPDFSKCKILSHY